MISPNPIRATLSRRALFISLLAAPSLAFFLIFWPALIGGKLYGNRTFQERLAIQLNAYAPESRGGDPLLANAAELIHPDYELLYQPANRAIQGALRNGHLPLQNPHRILGTGLWGSPVADPANPLSLALLLLTPEQTHLLKLYVYFVLNFAGIFLSCTKVFGCRPLPALTGACIYCLNPFMYYMYHWTALIGVVSLVPLAFYAVHTFLTKPSWWYLALTQGLVAWMLLINQLQVLLYFLLFLSAWIGACLLVRQYPLRPTLRRGALLALCALGGAALTLGHTWYLVQTGRNLARQPHTAEMLSRAFPTLLSFRRLTELWWNGEPPSQFCYDASMVFVPLSVVVLLLIAACIARPRLQKTHYVLAGGILALAVHCFVYPLHAPLYWVRLPLYNLNWEHWRIVYLLYLVLGFAAAASLSLLVEVAAQSRRTILGVVLAGGGALLAIASTLTRLSRGSPPAMIPLVTGLVLCVLAWAVSRGFGAFQERVICLCVALECLSLPMSRVPFSERSAIPSDEALSELPESRTMRLLSYRQIREPRGELLWYNDSVMSMFSRSGVTGYDTGLQTNEADLFASLYSPYLQRLRESHPFLRFGVQSSIVWPEAGGVLSPEATGEALGPLNEARVRLLGVGTMLWYRPIANLGQPFVDPVFGMAAHRLANVSPVTLLPEATAADVARLFSPAADNELAARVMRNARAIPVIFDQHTGSLRGQVPAAGGLLVVAYNFGRFYRPFIGGREATVERSRLPFVLVSKPPSEAGDDPFEMRPQTRNIWILLLSGVLIGVVILGISRRLCLWSERSSATVSKRA